jgi:hypothetical protein
MVVLLRDLGQCCLAWEGDHLPGRPRRDISQLAEAHLPHLFLSRKGDRQQEVHHRPPVSVGLLHQLLHRRLLPLA